MDKGNEAAAIMQKAILFGGMNEVHQYARQLAGLKLYQKAFEVFKSNYEKYPGQYTTTFGMARGYSALGDFKKALKFAEMAKPLVPDQQNKNYLETAIQKLKEGKDIN